MEENNIIEEKKENGKPKNNNKLLIIIILILLILLIITGAILLTKNSSSEEKNEENEVSDKEEKQDDKKVIELKGNLYLDKYQVVDKENEIVIMDLSEKEIAKFDKDYRIYETNNKLYAVKDGNDKKVVVKELVNDKFEDVWNLDKSDYDSFEFVYDGDKLIGLTLEKNNEESKLYLLDGKRELTLKDFIIYSHTLAAGDGRYVYKDNAITVNNNKYGLYDLKNGKELIKPKYDLMKYLDDGIYVAIKDNKAGVIDINDNTLLDFNYKVIEKQGDYYIVDKNDSIQVLDSKFKEIEGASLKIGSFEHYLYYLCCMNVNDFTTYNFKGNLIVQNGTGRGEDADFYYLDKDANKLTLLGKGDIKIEDNYLFLKKTDSTLITVYDSNLKKVVEINRPNGIIFNDFNIFLDNVLVADGKYFYSFKTGENFGDIKLFKKTYGDYEVSFNKTDEESGTITIKKGDEVLYTKDNMSFNEYIKDKNNGITVTNDYIKYFDYVLIKK